MLPAALTSVRTIPAARAQPAVRSATIRPTRSPAVRIYLRQERSPIFQQHACRHAVASAERRATFNTIPSLTQAVPTVPMQSSGWTTVVDLSLEIPDCNLCFPINEIRPHALCYPAHIQMQKTAITTAGRSIPLNIRSLYCTVDVSKNSPCYDRAVDKAEDPCHARNMDNLRGFRRYAGATPVVARK